MKLKTRSLPALAFLSVSACSSDHVKDIGLPCDIGVDAGASQAVYNVSTACSTSMCLKPVVSMNASMPTPQTGAFCTATCSSDGDCVGVLRDSSSPGDTRCKTGFACAVPFIMGDLCCQKICVCRDFLDASGTPTPPPACQGGAATATCR